MILWLLWTACLTFLLAADPHTSAGRARLRDRCAFYRGIVSCPACTFGWSGCAAEIIVRTREFIPECWHQLLPWWAMDMLGPVAAAAAGVGLGYLIEWISPMAATVKQIRWMEAQRGKT